MSQGVKLLELLWELKNAFSSLPVSGKIREAFFAGSLKAAKKSTMIEGLKPEDSYGCGPALYKSIKNKLKQISLYY